MRFHSKYELREIFPQVHHVGKQLSILINRMIVIIREEIFQSVSCFIWCATEQPEQSTTCGFTEQE